MGPSDRKGRGPQDDSLQRVPRPPVAVAPAPGMIRFVGVRSRTKLLSTGTRKDT